jgi:hypothetical protein
LPFCTDPWSEPHQNSRTTHNTPPFLLVSYLVFDGAWAAFEHFESHISAEIFAALPLRLLRARSLPKKTHKSSFVSTLNYMVLIEKG